MWSGTSTETFSSMIFYKDKVKKKPFARLHFSVSSRLLGFSHKYALVQVSFEVLNGGCG
jgi:hypothetical protein